MKSGVGRGRLIVGVTGTPGAGKSHFAKALSKSMHASIIEINDVAERRHAFSGRDPDGTRIADIPKLQKALIGEIDAQKESVVVVGHLLQEMRLPIDIVIVIRAKIRLIGSRLRKRGYGRDKLRENLTSEALDYCGNASMSKYRRVFEVESEAEKRMVIKALSRAKPDTSILKRLDARGNPKDKMAEFLSLIKKDKKLGL